MVHKIFNFRVIRLAFWTLGACVALLAGVAHAQAQGTPSFAMPQVQAESLAEVKITMPQGLPAERTLVMIGFEFDHQKVMDEWLDKMNLRPTQRPWLQLHGIGVGYSWLSGFINSRKRPYFPDAYQRERVVPVYTNVKAFITAMGLPEDTKTVYLLVVQRDGKVLATAQGRYDASAAQALLATLDATN